MRSDAHCEFDPPSSYPLEAEFFGPPPRTIPDSLIRGPYARKLQAIIVGLISFGVLCLLLSRAPGIDEIAQYILPLAYLQWIALGALTAAALTWWALARRMGPFRYVREGLPLIVRIIALQKAPSVIVSGWPSQHAFTATILFRHPESGDLVQTQVKSNDFSSDRKDRYDTPFVVGDYVTAVYLPGRFESTFRLYAFLELSADRCLRRTVSSLAELPWKVAAMVLAIVAIFAVLVGNVYIFGRYHPLSFDYTRALWPMILGATLIGGGMLGWL